MAKPCAHCKLSAMCMAGRITHTYSHEPLRNGERLKLVRFGGPIDERGNYYRRQVPWECTLPHQTLGLLY